MFLLSCNCSLTVVKYTDMLCCYIFIFQGTAGHQTLLCIGCTSVVQCERTVVLRSAEIRNFSAAECGKATMGNLWNVPHLIFRKLLLDNFPHSAIRIPQNTRALPRMQFQANSRRHLRIGVNPAGDTGDVSPPPRKLDCGGR